MVVHGDGPDGWGTCGHRVYGVDANGERVGAVRFEYDHPPAGDERDALRFALDLVGAERLRVAALDMDGSAVVHHPGIRETLSRWRERIAGHR